MSKQPLEAIVKDESPKETDERSKLDKFIDAIQTRPFKENPLVLGAAPILLPFSLAGIVKLIIESFDITGSAASFWTTITAITFGVIIILIFYVIPSLRKSLTSITIIFLITLSLFFVGWLMWVEFFTIPNLSIENTHLNNFKESMNAPKVETLNGWSQKISLDILNCQGPKIPDAQCVAEAFRNNKMPSISTNSVREKLANEIMAGNLLMKNNVIAAVLDTKLGVKDSFLGTGIALPQGKNNFSDARLPEYLITNMSDKKRDDIFTWILEPKSNHMDRPIKCLIIQCNEDNNIAVDPKALSSSPTPSNKNLDQKSVESYQETLKKTAEEFHREEMPILIRLSQFPKGKYEGMLGKSGSNRVFMCRLKDVWDMKLRDAILFSGHKIADTKEDDAKEDDAVFVWIYNPSNNNDLFPATWENIFSHPDWLK